MNVFDLVKGGVELLEELPKLLTLVQAVGHLVQEDPELAKRLDDAIAKAEAANRSRAAEQLLERELAELPPR